MDVLIGASGLLLLALIAVVIRRYFKNRSVVALCFITQYGSPADDFTESLTKELRIRQIPAFRLDVLRLDNELVLKSLRHRKIRYALLGVIHWIRESTEQTVMWSGSVAYIVVRDVDSIRPDDFNSFGIDCDCRDYERLAEALVERIDLDESRSATRTMSFERAQKLATFVETMRKAHTR